METEGLDFGAALESLAERYRRAAGARGRGPARRRAARRGAIACSRCSSAPPPTTCGCCGSRRGGARARVPGRARAGGGRAARVPRRLRAGARGTASSPAPGERATPRTSCSRRACPARPRRRGSDRPLPRPHHVPAGRRARPRAGVRRARDAARRSKPKYLNTSESELFHKGRIVYGADMARAAAARAGPRRARRGLHGRDRAAPGRRARGGRSDGHGADRRAGRRDRPARARRRCSARTRTAAGQESVAKGIAALRSHNKGRRRGRSSSASCGCPRGRTPRTSSSARAPRRCARCSTRRCAIERFEVERALELPGRLDGRDARRRRRR